MDYFEDEWRNWKKQFGKFSFYRDEEWMGYDEHWINNWIGYEDEGYISWCGGRLKVL